MVVLVCVASIRMSAAFGQGQAGVTTEAAPQPVAPPPAPAAPAATPSVYAPAPNAVLPFPGTPPTVHRVRRGWVTAGAIVFSVAWSFALLGSEVSGAGPCVQDCLLSRDYLWIPIAGPVIVAARRHDAGDSYNEVLLSLSLIETAGVAMAVFGLVGHDVPARPEPRVVLAPIHSSRLNGFALSATW